MGDGGTPALYPDNMCPRLPPNHTPDPKRPSSDLCISHESVGTDSSREDKNYQNKKLKLDNASHSVYVSPVVKLQVSVLHRIHEGTERVPCIDEVPCEFDSTNSDLPLPSTERVLCINLNLPNNAPSTLVHGVETNKGQIFED